MPNLSTKLCNLCIERTYFIPFKRWYGTFGNYVMKPWTETGLTFAVTSLLDRRCRHLRSSRDLATCLLIPKVVKPPSWLLASPLGPSSVATLCLRVPISLLLLRFGIASCPRIAWRSPTFSRKQIKSDKSVEFWSRAWHCQVPKVRVWLSRSRLAWL